jgi:uncharacterized integral membrane protein
MSEAQYPGTNMRIVNTLDELLQLPADKQVNGFRVRTPVKLELANLSSPALVSAQEALNRLQARRGSLAGAICMFLTLIYGVTQIFRFTEKLLSWEAVLGLGLVLVAAFGTGVIAKYLALTVTRWQFARWCRQQHRVLSAQTPRAAAV